LTDTDKSYYQEIAYINKTSKDIIELLIKNDPYEYKKYGNKIRRNYYDYRTAINLFDKAFERHPKSGELDKILYLKILALRDWKPDEVERMVKYFYRMFPKSKYIDDAFAELAFVQIIIQGNSNMGRKTIEKLLREYENTNACDNALNWLAYYQVISKDYKSAKETYEEILSKYPNTRFARYAKNNLIKIGENRNNKRDYINNRD
jgi:outer membrane protein assembly factor BamD (BamD/ComL family)